MKGHDTKLEPLEDSKNISLPFKLPTDPASILQNNGASNPLWPYTSSNNNNNNNNGVFPYYNNGSDSNENMIQQFAAALSSSNRLASQLNPSLEVRPPSDPQHENGENELNRTSFDYSLASSKLTLCGLEAYVSKPGEEKHIMLRIPKIADEPIENVGFDAIRDKYPPILEELFKQGPSDAFFLIKCWANVDFEIGNFESMSFAVDSFYDSKYNFDISVSTKVCSFGNQVVEKVEVSTAFFWLEFEKQNEAIF